MMECCCFLFLNHKDCILWSFHLVVNLSITNSYIFLQRIFNMYSTREIARNTCRLCCIFTVLVIFLLEYFEIRKNSFKKKKMKTMTITVYTLKKIVSYKDKALKNSLSRRTKMVQNLKKIGRYFDILICKE